MKILKNLNMYDIIIMLNNFNIIGTDVCFCFSAKMHALFIHVLSGYEIV